MASEGYGYRESYQLPAPAEFCKYWQWCVFATVFPGAVYGTAFENQHVYLELGAETTDEALPNKSRQCALFPTTLLGCGMCVFASVPATPMTAWAASYVSMHSADNTPRDCGDQLRMLVVGCLPCYCHPCIVAQQLIERNAANNIDSLYM